jgi:hypothetical protein
MSLNARHLTLSVWALLLTLLPVGCSTCEVAQKSKPLDSRWQRTELFFGLSKRGGGLVSNEEWDKFSRTVLVPAFPEGFTVISGSGAWRDENGTVRTEPSRVLIILHDDTSSDANDRINQVANSYIVNYEQEAVLRGDSSVTVRMYSGQRSLSQRFYRFLRPEER